MVAKASDIWVLQDPPIEFADLSSAAGTEIADTGGHRSPSPLQHGHPLSPNNLHDPHHPLINHTARHSTTYITMPISELFSPFFMVLRWGGLYFRCNVPANKSTDHLSFKSSQRGRYFLGKLLAHCDARTYEAFFIFLSFLSVIISLIDESRLIYVFHSQLTSGTEVPRLAVIVDNLETIKWAFQCIIVHIILMVMCGQGRFRILFDAWENVRVHYPDSLSTEKAYDFSRRFRRKQRILISSGMAILALNCYCLFGPLFVPLKVYDPFKTYIMEPFHPDNALIKTLIVVAMILRSFDYVFSGTLFLLISDALVLQFTQFYNDLAASISEDGTLLQPQRLEWHRLKHTRLCALVQRVDSIFSPYVLIGLVSGMFGVLAQVFVIYDFLKRGDMGVITVLSYVYWSLLNLIQVLVILWSGSKVNVAALLPLAKLYEIDQRTLTVEQTQHLTVFLQKLAGCQTGYTALGIFTIDMTTILSLAGFYFTYQILLFQMQNDSSLGSQLHLLKLPDDIKEGLRQFLNLTRIARA
ncbi:uncharacterized protein LOC129594687 [Paramacrobiotus metropolitanus]|uniref:uncharacterized protein LOC129594687 n=1 Tax=Paramacrobiotus metropolitanus TaxID=2943436 RepID=UPI0024460C99|nr:uncharacterized protein LOC129594687 [Paramacrobiotus metropolitanus]